MVEIKEVQEKGIYLLCGSSSGNSSLVEDAEEAQFFIESANSRFSDYMTIRAYNIQQDSWTFYCELKSKGEICGSYEASRKRSKKVKESCRFTEVWRIISEQVRHFLSRYVKFVNVKRGRKGSLRMESYKRYIIESEEEGVEILDKLRSTKRRSSQGRVQYRALDSHWKFGEKGRLRGYLVSELALREGLFSEVEFGAIRLLGFNSDVVRHHIHSTISLHKSIFKQE